jgi:hypothetical protein
MCPIEDDEQHSQRPKDPARGLANTRTGSLALVVVGRDE